MTRFLQLVGGLAIVVAFAYALALLFRKPPEPPKSRRDEAGNANVVLTVVLVLLFLLGLGACTSFESVSAGHVGVKVNFGEVDIQHPYAEGLSLVMPPWAELVEVDARMQKWGAEKKFDCASKDMQDVHVSLTINARAKKERIPGIYQETGLDYLDKILEPAASECLKAEISKHSAADILAARADIKDRVQATIRKWVEKYGVEVPELAITNISFDAQYEAAIRAKQVEEQKALQKTYELQRTQKEAEMAKAAAAGTADAAIEAARGRAEAVRLEADANAYSVGKKAEAESEANKKIAASLSTPDGIRVIELQRVQRWDGKLPAFVGGGVVPFLNVAEAIK